MKSCGAAARNSFPTEQPVWVIQQHPIKRLFVRFFLVQTLVDAGQRGGSPEPPRTPTHAGWVPQPRIAGRAAEIR
jgi:hypothetical protein